MEPRQYICSWIGPVVCAIGLAVACDGDDQGSGGGSSDAGEAGSAGVAESGGATHAAGAGGDDLSAGGLPSGGGLGGRAGAAGSVDVAGAGGAAGEGPSVELSCPKEAITRASGLCDPTADLQGISDSFEDCVFKVNGIFRYPERVIVTFDCASFPQSDESTEPAFQVVFDHTGYFHKIVLNESACSILESDPAVSVDLFNGQPCE